MNCLAIDDEPMALEIIKEYIQKTPYLNLKGDFRDALAALQFVQNNNIDLLFLDINMPDLSGIQFIKLLSRKPMVIFTTAYSEYAIQSYDLDAVDYLLKPIEFDRFLKASGKAYDKFLLKQKPAGMPEKLVESTEKDTLMIKSGAQIHQVKFDDIFFVEGTGNYVTFHTKEKKLLSLLSMSQAMDLLPRIAFVRIHKSYIVALKHLQIIEKHQVSVNGKFLPVGNMYRENFFKTIS